MTPLEQLAECRLPSGSVLSLHRRGTRFALHVDRTTLLSSETSLLEEAWANLGIEVISQKRQPRVILDGLLLGFALKQIASGLPSRATITVCEPEQALINWHRAHLRVLHGALLEDPRIRLLSEPLLEHLQRSRVPYDSILVNLDRRYQPASEAPSGRGNRPQLPWSLMQGSLRSGGRIVLWSETAQPQHERSLQRLGFTTTRHEIHPRPRGRGRRECVAVAALPYVSTAHGPRVQPPMFPGRRS